MANLTPQIVAAAGTAITYAAASGGGDVVLNAKGATLRVKNGDASSHTVTLTATKACDNGTLHDLGPTTVAAGAEKDIPIPAKCVNAATGSCAVTYSAVTSVTVAAIAG